MQQCLPPNPLFVRTFVPAAELALAAFQCERSKGIDKSTATIVFISGGPGVGKSRLLEELPSHLRDRAYSIASALDMHDPLRGDLLELFHPDSHVELRTTFTNGTSLIVDGKSSDGQLLAARRALHSAFCPPNMRYDEFIARLGDSAVHVQFTDVVSIIARKKHDPSRTSQRPLFVTYTVDEAQELLLPGDP
jgi:hypothetical protein